MKKFMKTALAASVLALASTSAHAGAYDFTTTFTSDNEITGFSINGNTVDLAGLSNLTNWKTADTLGLDLGIDASQSYTFQWDVINYNGGSAGGNPMGFLGKFDFDGTIYSSNTTDWLVSNDGGDTWISALSQSYNYPSVSSFGDYEGAQWIYGGDLFESMSVKTTIAASSPISAVPEPSTYAMMLGGLGMIAFMAARRKKQQA